MVKGSLLLAVLLSSTAVACGGTPAGQELWTSSSATSPRPTPTPDPEPEPEPLPSPPPCWTEAGCRAGETAFATITECTSSGADRCRLVTPGCGVAPYYCGEAEVQCDGYPSCDAGDKQVAACSSTGGTCYQRTLCGSTITCQKPRIDCKALPTCDAGDPEVFDFDDCNAASSDCYSRTTCGVTIWCNNVN